MSPAQRRIQLLQQILQLTPSTPPPVDLAAIRQLLAQRQQLMAQLGSLPPLAANDPLAEQGRGLTAEILARDQHLIGTLTRIRYKMLPLLQKAGCVRHQPRLVSLRG